MLKNTPNAHGVSYKALCPPKNAKIFEVGTVWNFLHPVPKSREFCIIKQFFLKKAKVIPCGMKK